MMSAITPMLSSSNQSPIKSVPPSNPPSSPIGLNAIPKIPVTPPSLQTSPSKPSVSVNHSPIPLSLVHENKTNEVQNQPIQPPPPSTAPNVAKTPEKVEKPKDLSPVKPTSNGVEESMEKPQPATATLPSSASVPSKPVEKPQEQLPVPNHSEVKEKPAAPAPAQKAATPEKPEAAVESAQNQVTNRTNKEEVKESNTTPEHQTNKRKRQKVNEPDSEPAEGQQKAKRIRSQVVHFQSPLPELATVISKSLKVPKESNKSSAEKLLVFYKNEFLAVRNAEGGFYLCQTVQNVYRSSHRIKIKWLSKDNDNSNADGDIYIPDFYDQTDFECILTTVNLEKLEKNKYKLPKVELERTENILKRALDVENGVSEKPSVTEEHPDGIDLSIYKDESQLQKPKKSVKKMKKKPVDQSEGAETKTDKKQSKKSKKSKRKTVQKGTKTAEKSKKVKKGSGKFEKLPTKEDSLKVSPPNDKARVVAKVLRKIDIGAAQETSSKKSLKSKGGKASKNSKISKTSKKAEKSAPTTSRGSERRGNAATSRKKTGKK